jgi:hypothetical protein
VLADLPKRALERVSERVRIRLEDLSCPLFAKFGNQTVRHPLKHRANLCVKVHGPNAMTPRGFRWDFKRDETRHGHRPKARGWSPGTPQELFCAEALLIQSRVARRKRASCDSAAPTITNVGFTPRDLRVFVVRVADETF